MDFDKNVETGSKMEKKKLDKNKDDTENSQEEQSRQDTSKRFNLRKHPKQDT